MKHNVFIVGPTGSGKSQVGLELALKNSGQIINVDSVQCYQGVEIGSAQPSIQEKQIVPHHLFGFVTPPEKLTAGKFRIAANDVIKKIPPDRFNFFVGGSGFYFDALEYGMFSSPSIPIEIKNAVEDLIKCTPDQLFLQVSELDPLYAKKVGANDVYRLGRALQVMRTTDRSVTEIEAEFKKNRVSLLNPQKVGLLVDRDDLRKRLETRLKSMIKQGLDDEVQKLLNEGYTDWWPLSSVGLKETVAFLRGRLTKEERESEIVKNSMGLAKRQMTWFRRDKSIEWFEDSNQLLKAF